MASSGQIPKGAEGLSLQIADGAREPGPEDASPSGYRPHERSAEGWSERLRRAERDREAALDATRAKDDFLAELSHELRVPLQAMTGWLALLRTGTLDAEMRQRALDVIERNLKAQAVLLDDLLDVARIATGKRVLEKDPVDLATIVSNAIDDQRLAARARGVALVGPSPGESLIVGGDASLLTQVVANLLTNALKFTSEGGVVRVALVPESAQAVLEIRDSGDGIAPELLPHVFERFRQGSARGRRARSSLGLGLAIAKALVEEQGGSITAASEGNGCGALFRVTLPRGAASR